MSTIRANIEPQLKAIVEEIFQQLGLTTTEAITLFYQQIALNKFEKDVKKAIKRGKDMDKLKVVINKLASSEPLEPRYKDHQLIGNYQGRRECHIESDWLLVYKQLPNEDTIIF
jgi:mRNA interferase YafQ